MCVWWLERGCVGLMGEVLCLEPERVIVPACSVASTWGTACSAPSWAAARVLVVWEGSESDRELPSG